MFLLFLYKLFSSECLSSSLSFFTLYFLVFCFVRFIAIGIGFARLQIIWLLLIFFFFFSIHQVAVLFNFNFSSFVGVVGWAVLAFLPGIADWLLFPCVFFWSVYCNWLRMAWNNLANADFLLFYSFHQLPELVVVQLSLQDLFCCWP